MERKWYESIYSPTHFATLNPWDWPCFQGQVLKKKSCVSGMEDRLTWSEKDVSRKGRFVAFNSDFDLGFSRSMSSISRIPGLAWPFAWTIGMRVILIWLVSVRAKINLLSLLRCSFRHSVIVTHATQRASFTNHDPTLIPVWISKSHPLLGID